MKTFLIISFLIHIMLIYAIYHLFQYVQKLKSDNKTEINSLLKEFLQEIKQENQRFEMQLGNNNKQTFNPPINREHFDSEFNVDENKLNQPTKQSNLDAYYKEPIVNEKDIEESIPVELLNSYEKKLEQVAVEDKFESSIEAQVFQMKNAGRTIEEIARQTNRGKTEILLMLKLSKGHKLNS